MMLGPNLISKPNPRISIPKFTNPALPISSLTNQIRPPRHFRITVQPQFHGASWRLVVRAEKEDRSGNGEEDALKKLRFNINWGKFLLDPDPDNVVAVGLAGLLTWASVQVFWQLLAVSVAIVVAALKYSFIAALLLFILIALL